MAQMLAPYNNAMRLGQGFNSYTQQICLDQAVLQDTEKNRKHEAQRISDFGKASTDLGNGPPAGLGGMKSLPLAATTEGGDISSALTPESEVPGTRSTQAVQVPGWVKPQIVTYSSRFVDKLSDVTDAMNISGSLSIKTDTIGGKANGSYVDSDKFQSSDIKFHLQVKVTNQIHNPPDYSIFNKIENLAEASYPEVYGDSYISGWEEGGELNAIISVKVHDKAKIFEIKVHLEAELTQPSIAGSLSGDFSMEKNKISKETETTITVNWSGGGSIKDPAEDWSIASLKKAAAAFPELVAITPQRTYAILTKYTALESFHRQAKTYSLLDYENAGIYTNSLLDRYMDYKALWKQISVATLELENNRADVTLSEPSQDIYDLAVVSPLPAEQRDIRALVAQRRKNPEQVPGNHDSAHDNADSKAIKGDALDNSNDPTHYKVFPASFAGLIAARQVCRSEMVKIVHEVDIVSKVPSMAADIRRDQFFLSPIVFKQLLPVVRSKTAEDAILGVKDPHAPLLLGYVAPPIDITPHTSVYIFDADIREYPIDLQKSVQKVAHRANYYRMRGCAGAGTKVHSRANLFNDLLQVDPTFRPIQFAAWATKERLQGLEIRYSNDQVIKHGACEGSASHNLLFESDGSEIITELAITEGKDANGVIVISAISVATSLCHIFDTTTDPNPEKATASATTRTEVGTSGSPAAASSAPASSAAPAGEDGSKDTPAPAPGPAALSDVRTHTWSRPDDGQWSLRGFFGFTQLEGDTKKDRIVSLGAVWGKDGFVPVPNARIVPPLSKQFLGLGSALRRSIHQISETTTFEGNFLMGNSLAAPGAAGDAEIFNALDRIDYGWRIVEIGFVATAGKLSGLRVKYQTGDTLFHGTYAKEKEVWKCEVKTSLVRAKITAGKAEATGPGYIDTVEFIRSEANGQLPAWPLNVSTLRYLGEGDKHPSIDVAEVVEIAPSLGNRQWNIRGFYGEHKNGLISRLGIIWGHQG